MSNKIKIFFGVLVAGAITTFVALNFSNNTEENIVSIDSATPQLKAPDTSEVKLMKKSVKRLKLNTNQVLHFDTPVTSASVQLAISILEVMTKQYDDVYVLISSPGGSVFDGIQLISYIESSPKRIHTVCMDMCASMAAHLHASGKSRLMFDNAVLMYHPASGGVRGQVENMNSQINMVKAVVDKLDAKIVSKSNMSYQEFKGRVAFEYWVLSDEALQKKLVDGITYITTNDPEKPFGVSINDALLKFQILDSVDKNKLVTVPEIK